MPAAKIQAELRDEIAAIAQGIGCELLEAEFRGGSLQIFLDRQEGGVTLEDCQTVSREVSPLLDVYDFGSGRYVLEVSSPGLDRKLYRREDYQRFEGQLARVTFFSGEERQKQTVVGRLGGLDEADEDRVHLVAGDSEEKLLIPLSDIKIARLEVEL